MPKRYERLRGEVETFIIRTGRKAPKSGEPNDRRFVDHDLQRQLRGMDPYELDLLMRGEPDTDELDPGSDDYPVED